MKALRILNIVHECCNVFRTFLILNYFIFSCPGHPLITASSDGFTLVKYVYIIIIYYYY